MRSKHVGVVYWSQDETWRNFGDFIAEWLVERVFDQPKALASDMTFLVGSVIDDGVVAYYRSLHLSCAPWDTAPSITFWACGVRDAKPLTPEHRQSCRILGARGPLTRQLLGLPDDAPVGDPGLMIRAFYGPKPASTAGKTVCVPHILDPKPVDQVLQETGCDVVLSPKIEPTLGALEGLIDQIASASLVLAGSLHAAIVACAYGVPYAFYANGHIDCPVKWIDFAQSVGTEIRYVRTVEEYRREVAPRRKPPKLPPIVPLLRIAPFSVQEEALVRGLAADQASHATNDQASTDSLASRLFRSVETYPEPR